MSLDRLIRESDYDFGDIVRQVHEAAKLPNGEGVPQLKKLLCECKRYAETATQCRGMIHVDAQAASEKDAAAVILDVRIQSAENVVALIERAIRANENPVIDIRELELVHE